ncbi:MAG: hypothetical protein AB3N14_19735, partial [Flavobacteriaceae bacterium]
LNEPTYRFFDQFREYFVQQIPTAKEIPGDTLFMHKNKPIFFKDQPIVRPDNFEDFWMNTPLQERPDRSLEELLNSSRN